MSDALLSLGTVVVAVNVAAAVILTVAIALVIERLVWRSALPLRHGILCVGVALTVASPLAAGLANGWGHGLVAVSVESPSPDAASDRAELEAASRFRTGGMHDSESDDALALRPLADPPSPPATHAGSMERTDSEVTHRADAPAILAGPRRQGGTSGNIVRTAGSLLVLIWAAGAAWLMLRLAHGVCVVARLRCSLSPINDPRVMEAARQAFAAIGVKPDTPVFESPLVPSPLTLCSWRPVVVMPRGLAAALDDEQLACVLAHEAAHVARHDAAIALLQRLAAAIFWWNPLLHAMNRRVNRLRERLCDDFVVEQRGDGVPLAEAIVRVAEWSTTRQPPLRLVVPLLEDVSELEDRITQLTQREPSMSIRLNGPSIAALGVFALALAAILMVPVLRTQVKGSEPAAPEPAAPALDAPVEAAEPPPVTAAKESEAPPDEATALIQVSGRARDMAGSPIAGAKIYLVSTNGIDRPLGETTTDAEGNYHFRDVKLPIKQFPRVEPFGSFQVYGEAEGYGFAWHGKRQYQPRPRPQDRPKFDEEHQFFHDEPIEMDLTFRPAATLTGSVKDEQGRPVANARITLAGLNYLDTEGREMSPNSRQFWVQRLAPPRFREVHTDDDGQFTFQGLPEETAGFASIRHSDYATQSFYVAVTDRPITEYRYIGNASHGIRDGKQVSYPIWESRAVKTSPLEIILKSTRRVVVEVVQDDNGAPAQGISIGASSGDFATGTHADGTTDEHGRVELKLPPGKYRLVADPPRETTYVRTYDDLNVTDEPDEQSVQLRLKPGCILILAAVDAVSGAPIADVNFWYETDDGGRTSVQSSTTYVDHPVTDSNGELRAVVLPGTRRYGAGFSRLPDGYKTPGFRGQLIECKAGETIRVEFKLTRE